MKKTFQFELNEKQMELKLDEERSLLWVLRSDLGLTGTKYGCGIGFCGACTVLVDKKPVRACMLSVTHINGTKIKTIEGLARNGELHSVQKAFVEHDAMQCGFCTSGMILNAYGLWLENPHPTREEIIQRMDHNLCRCGSYQRIVQAIQSFSGEMKGSE